MSGMRRDRRESLEDNLAALQQQQEDNLSDDDNAAPDIQSEAEVVEKEDPLLLAIDDLEGRVVSALDDVKLHPGVRSSQTVTVYEELSTLLRPVLEVAAFTGPSVARTYYSSVGPEGVEASCEEVYQRVVSDLVLPVMLEMAQSETIPSKRAASLEFFHNLWKETHKAGSWLDKTTHGPNAGPYGPGGSSSSGGHAPRHVQKRRQMKRLAREGEILRYWIQASIACTLPGAFTSDAAEGAVASRGVIAASASLRPSLKHICQRIQDADDRGAARLYGPVMKMVEGVLKKLFLSTPSDAGGTGDALRSACIKFIEIVILCCSSKAQPGGSQSSSSRRRGQNTEDFSLEDLPAGHPIITREALESVSEYAFSTLRGLALMGGQVKIDVNMLSDMMLGSDGDKSPTSDIISILKPATLAFLEAESSVMQDDETSPEFKIDRSDREMDFLLSQKSYSLTINAVSMLAINRPAFYKEAATCLARRAYDPPVFTEDGILSKPAVLAISAHLRASCLTLLRNPLSVTTNGWEILQKALEKYDMKIQAEKAVAAARQAAALKTAGRAARNRAAMFYEWDASEGEKQQRVTKRQRETDDALAKMRAARAAKGLGHGIQLPTSMVDAVELILLNLSHLPSKRPAVSKTAKPRKTPVTLDYVVDAVMTNGASLVQDDGRWYDRDGGASWKVELSDEPQYQLDPKLLVISEEPEKKKAKGAAEKAAKDTQALFREQCHTAASEAFSRIVVNSSKARSQQLADLSNKIAARLAWTLKGVPPTSDLKASYDMASESAKSAEKRVESSVGESINKFVSDRPLVASCIAYDATPVGSHSSVSAGGDSLSSLSNCVLNEAYMNDCQPGEDGSENFERSLDIYAASVVHASERANEKPGDNDRKRAATVAASSLSQQLGVVPSVTSTSLAIVSALCDLEEVTKKSVEASRKSNQQTLATSAAAHATKVAAEKRATAALLALRDVAFQRTNEESRRSAVDCAVGLAAGRLPATHSVEDKALKLVMNILFTRSESISNTVVQSASAEMEHAADFAITEYESIQTANKKTAEKPDYVKKSPLIPVSDEEKVALEKVKKPAVLFMALCVRRPEMIKTLMEESCKPKADVLLKAVRANMPKLAKAAATKYGAATIARKVADMAGSNEIPMVLAFLDNLAPASDKALPSQELIDACHEIQQSKLGSDGKPDVRFIIPVLTGMKREALVENIAAFVRADDKIFMAALVRMSERVSRQALLFRDEPDPETSSLTGMTLCEQLVFLHRLDFAAVGLPQKRYLDAIRLCLDHDDVFSDRVVMAALDYISGTFLTTEEKLPLAYMRTIILTCTKHESLHSWICHVLLPRLVEGKVYTDRRQWEGWMRCAKILEDTGNTGVSSLEAIEKLPPDQLQMYRTKYPKQ